MASRKPYIDDGKLGINLPPEQQSYDPFATGAAEFTAALESGEPFEFCLTCRHVITEPDHACVGLNAVLKAERDEVTADGL